MRQLTHSYTFHSTHSAPWTFFLMICIDKHAKIHTLQQYNLSKHLFRTFYFWSWEGKNNLFLKSVRYIIYLLSEWKRCPKKEMAHHCIPCCFTISSKNFVYGSFKLIWNKSLQNSTSLSTIFLEVKNKVIIRYLHIKNMIFDAGQNYEFFWKPLSGKNL